jgi:hypothetical protein
MLSMMVRQQKTGVPAAIEVAVTPKFVQYLDDLIEKEGFGTSRAEVFRKLAWDEINRLIEARRLTQR